MNSFLDVLAHEDHEGLVARRQALALAHKRTASRFNEFLSQRVASDYTARLELIRDEFRNVVREACAEVGHNDPDPIERTLWNDRLAQTSTVKSASVDKEARRGKLCPYHGEVVDISLAQGEPAAGYNAMGSHAWGAKHCQSDEWGGDKCNFKPQMTTQSYWDEKSEKAEQRKQDRAERAEQETQQFDAPQMIDHDQDGDPSLDPEMAADAPSADVIDFPSQETSEAAEPGLSSDELMSVAASFQREAWIGQDIVKGLNGVTNAEGAAASGLVKGLNTVGDGINNVTNPIADYLTPGSNPNIGTDSTPPAAAQALPPHPGTPAPATPAPGAPAPGAPSAAAIHDQFSQMGFGPGTHNRAYNPDAHSIQNYQQVADKMGLDPNGAGAAQVRDGLDSFYKDKNKAPGVQPATTAPPVNQRPLGSRQSDTLHTVDVTQGSETPNPTMDKAKWTPKAFDQPLDTEAPGSPNPTRRVDIQPDLNDKSESPQNADSRHPGKPEGVGEQVTERVDVTKNVDNFVGDRTKTWR